MGLKLVSDNGEVVQNDEEDFLAKVIVLLPNMGMFPVEYVVGLNQDEENRLALTFYETEEDYNAGEDPKGYAEFSEVVGFMILNQPLKEQDTAVIPMTPSSEAPDPETLN